MAGKFDYKKEYKDLYMPKQKPVLIDVPVMNFIMVDGAGDPNTSEEYQEALEILYGLSFAIKMSKMSGKQPAGYFEYVVPPLEGLWWFQDDSFDGTQLIDKSKFQWTSMIRQPEFVTEEVFDWAVSVLKQKKPKIDPTKARLVSLTEGLCVQMMHNGPYDSEPVTLGQMEQFLLDNGYRCAISDILPSGQIRRHHEIYLSDPRKTTPEKLRTVLRHPVKKI
ncbi:GyrI-like domain-containing protein [Desulfosporosinus sp. SYSU MS00001]|uniref:GyrI-like domain-containing protein n=1 Tax=Desulfosporosinus sp. SYSU MS00001 TaxID=3416284 RepID=UPI003CF46307